MPVVLEDRGGRVNARAIAEERPFVSQREPSRRFAGAGPRSVPPKFATACRALVDAGGSASHIAPAGTRPA
ncbi:hypothetical protein JMG10_16305 [Nostoc ellipsosporum NOK]|nr:hypothetical protein [Nostoc ellipsosporum NOK]